MVIPKPGPESEVALEEERKKVRQEYEARMEELKREKEEEAKGKQAMQSEVDLLKKRYEEELAALAEKAKQQVGFVNWVRENHKLSTSPRFSKGILCWKQ